jgi:hypothetical protein
VYTKSKSSELSPLRLNNPGPSPVPVIPPKFTGVPISQRLIETFLLATMHRY